MVKKLKALIVYDSVYGNTKKIADVIAKTIDKKYYSQVLHVSNFLPSKLQDIDLLIIGTPVYGGRPKSSINTFIESLPKLNRIKCAVFDTRISTEELPLFLKLLVNTIGYASPKVQKILVSKGGVPITNPGGFIVLGKEGPLKTGEEKLAEIWSKDL